MSSMNFNIKKYERMTFHKDEVVNKRIIALFLWFDYEIIKKKLTYKQQVRLIDYWCGELSRMEYYEIIPFFKNRRTNIVNKWKKEKSIKDKVDKTKKFWKRVKGFFISLFKRP